jgi:RNA polymerase sigma-70 factor (ECF subfamily)
MTPVIPLRPATSKTAPEANCAPCRGNSGAASARAAARLAAPDPLADLLHASARGDRAAFARLYELTSGPLFALSMKLLRARDAAEDALQESFVRVWRSAHRFDPNKGGGMTWLVTITRNVCLSAIERRRRIAEPIGLTAQDETIDPEPDPLEQTMRRRDAQRLAGCLQKLESKQQESLRLVYFEGLTHSELAARLDAPLGTVKSWVRRGLMQLKTCLEGVEAENRKTELLAAEYVMGTLRGAARRRFEALRETDAVYCFAADAWEERLAPLVEALAPVAPSSGLWESIERRLVEEAGPTYGSAVLVERQVALWRFAAITLGGVLLVMLALAIFAL